MGGNNIEPDGNWLTVDNVAKQDWGQYGGYVSGTNDGALVFEWVQEPHSGNG